LLTSNSFTDFPQFLEPQISHLTSIQSTSNRLLSEARHLAFSDVQERDSSGGDEEESKARMSEPIRENLIALFTE